MQPDDQASRLQAALEAAVPQIAALGPMRPPLGTRVLHALGECDVGETDELPLSEIDRERDVGLEPLVVTEMGFRAGGGYARDDVSGVPHRRIPGAARGDAAPAKWPVAYATRLAKVVVQVRPRVLVVHGDDLVAHAARIVAEALDLPMVMDRPDGDNVVLLACESLGILPPGTAAMRDLRPDPADLGRLQPILRERGHPPLEEVFLHPASQSPADMARLGWIRQGLPPVSLQHPVAWRELCLGNRTHGFHLHAWEFMDPWLQEHRDGGDVASLTWCLDLALSWCREFTEGEAGETMAWYDMALAIRAPKLAYLLDEAVRLGLDESVLDLLHAAVVRHQQELFRPTAFVGHNNHGFYTAVGQLGMARRLAGLPGMDVLHDQGRARLDLVVRRQFAPDGGHLEHSPDYHRMLLDSFAAAVDGGLVDEPDIVDLLHRAQDVMGWFIRPDGVLVQIGDSPARRMTGGRASTRSPHTAFIASQGRTGVPDDRTMLLLPDSGYALVRSPQPSGPGDRRDSGYLSVMAGFHSRTHKHADDLSLTWFDAGQEILVDPGRFGYLDLLPQDSPERLEGFFYSRPERQYVESTRAHCTVEADGKDHDRRNRAPYGSALIDGGEGNGHHWVLAEVDHGHWTHRRSVALAPGQWLWVRDEVEGVDETEHDFAVWWQLADTWEVAPYDGPALSFRSAIDGSTLWLQSWDETPVDGPVSAQLDPLRGWRSVVDHEMSPCWSIALRRRARRHVFDTVLSLGARPLDALPAERPDQV